MSSARYALLRLNDGVPHTKNWRPQILLLTKLDDNYAVKDDKVLDFVTQLKAGKGTKLIKYQYVLLAEYFCLDFQSVHLRNFLFKQGQILGTTLY